MKILQLIHTRQNRGAEIFACQLSNHLQQFGHEVKVVSLYGGEAELGYRGEIISLGASKTIRFIDITSWRRLFKIIQEFNPDIVQANAGDTLKYAFFSKYLFGWENPIIVRNASEVGKYIRSSFQKNLYAHFFKKVHKVISVSKASEKDIINLFPFLKGKTLVIGIGLERVEEISNFTYKPQNRKHIVHVSGFSFEKNHLRILEIFKLIYTKESTAHLHFVGDGDQKNRVQKQANKMQLSQAITFHGFVNNPLAYIKAADVLILPSIIEGLPGVILEAMYCKTPVVAYDVGGVGEIVTSKTGTLIPVNQEEQFADATRESLENPSKQQIQGAYEMVLNNFMNNYISHQFIKAYKKAKPSR